MRFKTGAGADRRRRQLADRVAAARPRDRDRDHAAAAAPLRLPAPPGRRRQPDERSLPSVTAVVPTRNRPELLDRAVRAILAQDYDGNARGHDRRRPGRPGDRDRRPAGRPADPRHQQRTQARPVRHPQHRHPPRRRPTSSRSATTTTSGCRASSPRKQVARSSGRRLRSSPAARSRSTSRAPDPCGLPARASSRHDDLLPSRMSMLHSSTFVIRRARDDRRHRAGRRGRAGQPERGLGPVAAGVRPGGRSPTSTSRWSAIYWSRLVLLA